MIRTVGRCAWAQPTVFRQGLEWTDSAAAEWTCCADPSPQLLDDARVCRTCGRWIDRSAAPALPPRIDEPSTSRR